MKTNSKVSLEWRHCFASGANHYEASAGDYTVDVEGKKYTIWLYDRMDAFKFEPVFEAKARSVKDAFQRSTNKLMKFLMQDTKPNPTFALENDEIVIVKE